MSWGFYIDLDLTLPTATWKQLKKTTVGDHAVAAGWWGLKSSSLEERFLVDDIDGDIDEVRLANGLRYFDGRSSHYDVREGPTRTTLRVTQLLDRGGETSIAKVLAAIVEGSQAVATGFLQLVNDGTYSGERGVRLVIESGTLARSHLADREARVLQSELSKRLFGDIEELIEKLNESDAARSKSAAKSKLAAKPKAAKSKPKPKQKPKSKPKPKPKPKSKPKSTAASSRRRRDA